MKQEHAETVSNHLEDAAQSEDNIASIAEHHAEISPIEALEAELSAMKDQWLRAVAENENLRKRAERDQAETRKYAVTEFARDMTSVCENLHRALDSMPLDELEGAENAVLKTLHTGVEMTRSELLKTFERHGVVRVTPNRGDAFDHNLHQAVSQVTDAAVADGHIAHVIQSGYQLKERLLQPAMVAVAKNPKVDTTA